MSVANATANATAHRTAIEATGLRKTYPGGGGEVAAVKGIDLRVHAGEVFGLLGPNGAGKTTTVRMLTTRTRPSAGTVKIMGYDIAREPDAVKRRIGVVTQHNTLDRQLTVLENLEFRGRFAGLTVRAARRRGRQLLSMFELSTRASAQVMYLSGGQAQRLMIARALMHRPEVLFLDEPTSGLDPQTRVKLWEAVREMRSHGQTILLTTHYMEEAEALCDRIAILDHGEILACDTLPALISSVGADTVLSIGFDADADKLVETALGLRYVNRVEADDEQLRVFTRHTEWVLPELIRIGPDAGLVIRDIRVLRPSLETTFLTLTGQEYRE